MRSLDTTGSAARLWTLTLALALGACGDDNPVMDDGGADFGPPDMPAPGLPDGSVPCANDDDCDDTIGCTRDICDDRGVCVYRVEPGICDDGTFCNGTEVCDPIEGCLPGVPETCNDDDVCTIDRCDEEAKLCRRTIRDFDEDGEADWFCEGGTDCDDRDPTRGTTINEVCDDGIDNDCDEDIDEAECGAVRYDACDDPLDVSAGGFFELTSLGAVPDYELGCAPSGRRDLVLTFELSEPQDVTVRAEGRSITYVALRSTCDDRDSELECNSGFPGAARRRSLPVGQYYVLVADIGGDVGVEVVFEDPTEPPTNESCAMPLDVSAGGTFPGSLVDVADDVSTSCGSTNAPDLVYTFTTTEERDVVVSAASLSGDSLSVAVQSTCGDEDTDLRCVRGSTAGTRLHQVPAGTYFAVVEGSSSRENDFSLDIAFEAPTPPPAGDLCSNAIPITAPATITGTLADKQDDIDLSCGFNYRDIVYEVTLTERSDLVVVGDGSGSFMYVGIQETCGDDGSQLRCTSGNPSRSRIRDLSPGSYYIVVESFSGTSFELEIEASDPTVPVAVSGNDTCETAHVIPPAGGLFSGTTATALADYETALCGSGARSNDVAFRLDLTETKSVVATTDGSAFDTVLHMHTSECVTLEEEVCNDDGGEGSTSRIERTLNAGTHYFIVDGWSDGRAGDYFFEVTVSDP